MHHKKSSHVFDRRSNECFLAYLVAVMRAERMPIMPLVGTRNFSCVWPSDPSLGPISVISPLRLFSRDTTALLKSFGTVMSTISNGSHLTPSMVFSMTVGGPTINSKPSRRMFSIKTVKCSCPRPHTYTTENIVLLEKYSLKRKVFAS